MQVIPVSYFEQQHPLIVGYGFGGGVIGYVEGDFPNQRAIIISYNWIGDRQWGTNGVDVVGTSTALFSGSANTDLIIASEPGFDSAAKLARNFNGEGYTDWCLPSFDDLVELCANKDIMQQRANINFDYLKYSWSSSQYASAYPWNYDMRNGANCDGNRLFTKSNYYGVRPIRYVTYNPNIQQQ